MLGWVSTYGILICLKSNLEYDVFCFDWRVYGEDYGDVCRGVGSGGIRMMARGHKRSVGGWREKWTRRGQCVYGCCLIGLPMHF